MTVSFLSLRNLPEKCTKCLSSNGGNNIFPLLTAMNVSCVCDFEKKDGVILECMSILLLFEIE